MTIFITLHNSQQDNQDTTSTIIQQAFQTILNTSHKQLITLPFIIPFSSLELINMDKSTHHQVSLPPNTYYKEIQEFHTLNKGLEIHLFQIVEQSLRDLSLSLSLGSKSIQSIQTNYHNKILKLTTPILV